MLPQMSRNQYLKKQGNTWHVVVQVPVRLRKAAGCWAFIRTLGTGDVNEANQRKHLFVADFKRRIAQLERGETANDVVADLYDQALAWSATMARAKSQVLYEHPEGPEYLTDFLVSQISDEAKEVLEEHGEKAAALFYNTATGQGTPPLRTLVDRWLDEQDVTLQRKQHHRAVIGKFLAWTGDTNITISDVTRKVAGDYASYLLSPASKIERSTAQNYVGSLSTLWVWLETRGVTESNPWLRLGLSKRGTRGDQTKQKRTQWTDDALAKLLSGTYTTRYHRILHDLVRLALGTGARIEELCVLKMADVNKRDDGWWVSIWQGKTEAAVRTIPVHDCAAHVLERRSSGTADEYLFDSLLPGGADKRRSSYVSKAFRRYKDSLGLQDGKVFHSLRKTFVEALEAAQVPVTTIQLLIGHKRKSLALTTYSTGARVDLREAIEKLQYSKDLDRLIRQPPAAGDDETKPLNVVKGLRARSVA
jgi:integrase